MHLRHNIGISRTTLLIRKQHNIMIKLNSSVTYLYKPKQNQNFIKYTLQFFFRSTFISSSKFLIKKLGDQFSRSILLVKQAAQLLDREKASI
jgi:hypothetical protein